MTMEEARRIWRENAAGAAAMVSQTSSRVRATEQFKAQIFRRDCRETIAAAVVVVSFTFSLFVWKQWVSCLGAVLIIVDAVAIIVTLHLARTRGGEAPMDAPVTEYFQLELQRVGRQIRLLKRIAIWLLSPLIVGFCMIKIGELGVSTYTAAMCFSVVLFGFFIHWLNQREVKRRLLPLQQSLTATLSELSTENQ